MRLSPHLRRGGESLSRQVKQDVTPIAKPEPRPKKGRRLQRAEGLTRTAGPARTTALKSTGPVSPATPEQKAKVEGLACIALGHGECWGPIDPMHLIDRSMAASAGNDIRAVVPACRRHHNAYDEHELDLSALLEPRWRDEVAWAVEAVGLFVALRRITGRRWAAIDD